MKTFIVLCAFVALVASGAVRDKRSYGHGWSEPSHGWGQQSHGWSQPQVWGQQSHGWDSGWHAQPQTKVIAVKKVVNVQREVTVPQVVHVRKVINEPRVVVVHKEVPVQRGHFEHHAHHAHQPHHGWW